MMRYCISYLLNNFILISTFIILLAVIKPNLAAAKGAEGPLTINADSAVIDEKKGIATYSGNVILEQGEIMIQCDSLEIYRSDDIAKSPVKKVIAQGQPASFSQVGDTTLKAEAYRITYDLQSQSIELFKKALIRKDDNRFEGESITYKIAEEQIIAKSKKDKDSSSRVKIVLPTAP